MLNIDHDPITVFRPAIIVEAVLRKTWFLYSMTFGGPVDPELFEGGYILQLHSTYFLDNNLKLYAKIFDLFALSSNSSTVFFWIVEALGDKLRLIFETELFNCNFLVWLPIK